MKFAERAALVVLLGSGCAGRSEQRLGETGGEAAGGAGGTGAGAGGTLDGGGASGTGGSALTGGLGGSDTAGGSGGTVVTGGTGGTAGAGGAPIGAGASGAGSGGNGGVAGAGQGGEGASADISCNCDYPDVAYCFGSVESVCAVVPAGGCASTLDELTASLLASCPPDATITYERCDDQPVIRFAEAPPDTYRMTFDAQTGALVGGQAIGRILNTCGDTSRLTTFQAGNPAYRACKTLCTFCPAPNGEGGQAGETGQAGSADAPPCSSSSW